MRRKTIGKLSFGPTVDITDPNSTKGGKYMKGTIFNIQKFCVNDGPGIRTTVFLKGCPLKCIWCHNPESQSEKTEIMFYKDKCVNCGRCAAVCKNNCHSFDDGVHKFERKNCIKCFECTKIGCEALEKVGREISADEVIDEVLKDKIFYDNSGGGITLSGGEPLCQFDFSLEILKLAKENELHTAMETCGFTSTDRIEEISKYVDLFLFDYKETNSELHKKYIGIGNEVILENLSLLNSMGKSIILRCPIIPGCNDRKEHFEGICNVANKFENVLHIEIEPYHSLGESKYESLGLTEHKFHSPSDQEKETLLLRISTNTDKKVVFA